MSNQAASRRSTLLMAGAGLGAALIPLSAAPAAAATEPVPTADPISAQPAPMAPLMVTEPYRKTLNYGWHVARRLSLAPTHALAEEINKAGWQAWIIDGDGGPMGFAVVRGITEPVCVCVC